MDLLNQIALKKKNKMNFAMGLAGISGEGGGYSFGNVSEEESETLLKYAFDKGLWLYDTAPIYGFGESEKRLGRALKKVREDIYIIDKCGVHWHDNKRVDMTNDPKIADKMLHDSLRRLESDYIDLYMIHWPDSKVDIRRPLEVLVRAQEVGKIRNIGLCNTNVEDLNKAKEIAKIEAVQFEFNLFQQKSHRDFLNKLLKDDISVMTWGTLEKGILAGTVHASRVFDSSDCRSWAPWWKSQDKNWKYQVADEIKKRLPHWSSLGNMAQQWTMTFVALAYNLTVLQDENGNRPFLLSGPKNKGQLDLLLNDFIKLEKTVLPEQVLSELESVVDNLRP